MRCSLLGLVHTEVDAASWVWLVLLLVMDVTGSRAGCPERAYNGAIRLQDGRGLVVGFAAGCIYDPQMRAWTRTSALHTPRREARPAVLADGNVLLAGGHTDALGILDYEPAPRAEVLTLANGQWNDGGELSDEILRGHSVFAMADGRALTVGATVQFFEPVFRTWQRASAPGIDGFAAAIPLGERQIFLIGGESAGRYAEPVTVYDGPAMHAAERWLPAQDRFEPAVPMNEPRALQAAVLLSDGRVLVLAGCETSQVAWRRCGAQQPN